MCVLALQVATTMLLKGLVEPMAQPGPGYYSRLFLQKKVTGDWRPVIGVSALNEYITLTKFRMETVSSVISLIRWGDLRFFIVLTDTYSLIPIHPESQPYLRFCLEGRMYQFRALLLRSFHGSTSFHQSLSSGFGVGTSQRSASPPLLGRLADGCRVKGTFSPSGLSSPVV